MTTEESIRINLQSTNRVIVPTKCNCGCRTNELEELIASSCQMRDWLEDCFEDVDFNDFTQAQLINAVEYHYDGGVAQFRLDA